MKDMIRIGNGQGFWGDSIDAPVNLVKSGPLDYLTLDYLAEVTLSIMQRQKLKNPNTGYARDFINLVDRILPEIQNNNLKVYGPFTQKDFLISLGINKRKDNIIKILTSKIANQFRNIILKDDCADSGCSLKVFDKEVFLSFPFFNGIHRFLPSLFIGFGHKVKYMSVSHRPRLSGVSKYGILDRLFKGIRDIIKVKNIIKGN